MPIMLMKRQTSSAQEKNKNKKQKKIDKKINKSEKLYLFYAQYISFGTIGG